MVSRGSGRRRRATTVCCVPQLGGVAEEGLGGLEDEAGGDAEGEVVESREEGGGGSREGEGAAAGGRGADEVDSGASARLAEPIERAEFRREDVAVGRLGGDFGAEVVFEKHQARETVDREAILLLSVGVHVGRGAVLLERRAIPVKRHHRHRVAARGRDALDLESKDAAEALGSRDRLWKLREQFGLDFLRQLDARQPVQTEHHGGSFEEIHEEEAHPPVLQDVGRRLAPGPGEVREGDALRTGHDAGRAGRPRRDVDALRRRRGRRRHEEHRTTRDELRVLRRYRLVRLSHCQ
mmetsp:Transcript_2642/g.8259  ORF Transcript_2642/g.8259 Transcript_2642/m.8259 type:complete len:295 (-) Transcript_2642:25-909(-)